MENIDQNFLNQIPVDNNADTSAVSSYVSDYAKAIESIKLWVLGKKKNPDGSLTQDRDRTPLMTPDQATVYINALNHITAKPVPFSNSEYNTNQTKIVFAKDQLRWVLIEEFGLDLGMTSQLMEIFDTFATAVLSSSVDGFITKQITQHLSINELRTPNQEQKKGFGLPRLFKRRDQNESQ